jgi:tripartite-type tricarboxylate transporter receptor subunit TctC
LLTRSGPNRHGRSHKNKKQTLGRSNMQFRLNFRPTALAAFGLLAAAAAFSAGAHAADEWPARDIIFYVPYAPGGSTDPISRKYAELLEKQLNDAGFRQHGGVGAVPAGDDVAAIGRPR